MVRNHHPVRRTRDLILEFHQVTRARVPFGPSNECQSAGDAQFFGQLGRDPKSLG